VREADRRRTPSGAATKCDCWRGRAFGLEVAAELPVLGVPEANGVSTTRVTTMKLVSAAELEERWRGFPVESIVDRRFADGRLMMSVEHSDNRGYRIYAPRYGRHVVSGDGTTLHSALPRIPAWRWQRLLFAQVLPIAAALQGLSLLHASAVAFGGRALAFSAPSGTGKTSVAAHLVAQGASFLTDDALALEPAPGGLLAHPGAGMASIDEAEWQAMSPEGRARLGRRLGRSDKSHFAVDVAERPLPLAAVYFLQRNGQAERQTIEQVRTVDPGRLLGSAFVTSVRTPEYLTRQLEACAVIAESVDMFEVVIPAIFDARQVAANVERHAREARDGEVRA
jgi:hypothetical protein